MKIVEIPDSARILRCEVCTYMAAPMPDGEPLCDFHAHQAWSCTKCREPFAQAGGEVQGFDGASYHQACAEQVLRCPGCGVYCPSELDWAAPPIDDFRCPACRHERRPAL